MLVLSVCLVGVAGPSSAERSSPPPTTKCTAGEAAHTLGQKIYVPAYSHIYYQNQKRRCPLAVTLSIRNTDEQHPLKVTSTRYVGTEGQVLKEYVETPILLGPLASTEFFVDEQDKSGDSVLTFCRMGRRAARLWTGGGGGDDRDGRYPGHFVCEYWAGSLSSYSVDSVAVGALGFPGDVRP